MKKDVTVVVGAPNLETKPTVSDDGCYMPGVTEDATSWACGWRFAPCSVVQLVSKCKEDPDSLLKSVSSGVSCHIFESFSRIKL